MEHFPIIHRSDKGREMADEIEGTEETGFTEAERRDRDETRRLLYMALVVNRTKRYNLVGTIANAIRHHQGQDVDTDEMLDRLVRYVEGQGFPEDDAWVRDQIKRIIDELGD
jgi:hypothetical protein